MRANTIDHGVTLHQLEILRQVVDLGSVTEVAKDRYISQPAVSGQLRSLERRLGTKLVYWDGRRMRLTDAGRTTYAWARTVLEGAEALQRELDGIHSGRAGAVAVGASIALGNYLLPPVIFEVRRRIPDLHVALRVFDPVTTVADLEDGQLDFAVVAMDTPPRSNRVAWRSVGVDELVLVTAPGAFPSELTDLDSLTTLPFICAVKGQTTRRLIDENLALRGVTCRAIVMECGSPETLKAAVRGGIGVAFVTRRAAREDLIAGTLCEMTLPGPALAIPVMVGCHIHRRLSWAQQALFDAIISELES